MSEYKKINSYTWVQKGGSGANEKREELQTLIPNIKKEVESQKKKRNNLEDYREFCKTVFKQKKILTLREFNQWVKARFNQNFTWYRDRMESLKLIEIKHYMIKPGSEL